jgi:putative Holliday junction resolvase
MRNAALKIMGIDYGGRRVGIAVSDALGIAAHGLPTLIGLDETELVREIARLAREREVEEIVVGLPRNMDDTLGPQAVKTIEFARKLQALERPVKLVDERLTTERAYRTLDEAGVIPSRRRRQVDRMAAQFILQIYLDSRGAAGRDISEFD